MAPRTKPKTPTDTPADAVVDVVAVPSLRADGTPDQTPGFVQLVDAEPEQAEES